MTRELRSFIVPGLTVLLSTLVSANNAFAQEPATIRSQAVVSLSFDESQGNAADSATAGATKDDAVFVNGPQRIRSPFWGQKGKQALIFDANAKQYAQIPDSADLDRPDAVTFSLFFANLHPANEAAFHGLVAKRDEQSKKTTNYGINYGANNLFQVYLADGSGFKAAVYPVNAAVGTRRPNYITAVLQVGDAPSPDADEDKDDVLVRFYSNGKPISPIAVNGGMAAGADAWLTDVKVDNLVNDVPVTLGASSSALEYASCVIDEFNLFPTALSAEQVAQLFKEVAGANVDNLIANQDKGALPSTPEITSVSPLGIQAGTKSVLTIRGTNLLPEPKVVLGVPVDVQTIRPGAKPNELVVEITVPPGIAAGHYPLHVQTARGISGTLPVAIDGLPQIAAQSGTPDKPISLPTALSGTISGQQQFKVFFQGKAGQRIVVDLECKRLGSGMDPVLELKNPRGAPVQIAWGKPHLNGDARIETVLSADGLHSVELHDLAYKAPGQNNFRLKIGDLRLIDTSYPSAISIGSGVTEGIAAIGTGLVVDVAVPIPTQTAFAGMIQRLTLPPGMIATGPVPGVLLSDVPEFLESPTADGSPQTIDAQFTERTHVPLMINGRIARPGETDRYLLTVKPGMTLNVRAEREGIASPLEPQLIATSHPDGNLLALSEERPAMDIALPANVAAVQLAVRDLNGRGGASHVYRLRVLPAGQPDFNLSVNSNQLLLPREGNAVLQVSVDRAGYDGPIRLSVIGAEKVSLSPEEIPEGVTKTFIVVSADEGAAANAPSLSLRLLAESTGLNPPIRRIASGPVNNRLSLIPGYRGEIAARLSAPSQGQIELAGKPEALLRGTDLSIPVVLKSDDEALVTNAVRLTLMTTEAPRMQIDPSDRQRRRRVAAQVVSSLPEQYLAAGETAGELRVTVPAGVAEKSLSCIVRADFVPQAFSDKVLATVYSQPFQLPVRNSVTLQPAAPMLNLTGNGETKLTWKLKRARGFNEPVALEFLNLPVGYKAEKVTVPGDQESFEVAVTSPAVAAVVALKNITLRVTGGNGQALLNDIAVPVNVNP